MVQVQQFEFNMPWTDLISLLLDDSTVVRAVERLSRDTPHTLFTHTLYLSGAARRRCHMLSLLCARVFAEKERERIYIYLTRIYFNFSLLATDSTWLSQHSAAFANNFHPLWRCF